MKLNNGILHLFLRPTHWWPKSFLSQRVSKWEKKYRWIDIYLIDLIEFRTGYPHPLKKNHEFRMNIFFFFAFSHRLFILLFNASHFNEIKIHNEQSVATFTSNQIDGNHFQNQFVNECQVNFYWIVRNENENDDWICKYCCGW